MPTTSQARSHGDRNVVPDDAQHQTETTTGECPFDTSNLAHMRSVSPDDD